MTRVEGEWSQLIKSIVTREFSEDSLQCLMADAKSVTLSGSGPLFFAAIEEDLRFMEFLLKQPGIDANQQNYYGETPLHWAAYKGSKKHIRLLLAHGALSDKKDGDGFSPVDWEREADHYVLRRRLKRENSRGLARVALRLSRT